MPPPEDSSSSDLVEWSPWTHPKAKRWFEELLEETDLPLMMEHAVDKADDSLDEGQTRLMVALALLFGRDGIWPAVRDPILRAIVRKGSVVANRSTSVAKGPITISQHKDLSNQHDHLVEEVEILRRRIGMSNRKTPIKPPAWGKFWS
jgi:hypothetical protein